MFTGLIQEIGTIRRTERTDAGLRWWMEAPKMSAVLRVGDSISTAGICQTVEECGEDMISATAIPQTLRITTADQWRSGTRVNLESALRLGDTVGGHLVSGHIDTEGRLTNRRCDSAGHVVTIAFSPEFDSWVVDKGSIAIDGISLTIAARQSGTLEIALIPETLANTTLGDLEIGADVNLEFDQLIKAVIAHVTRSGFGAAIVSASDQQTSNASVSV